MKKFFLLAAVFFMAAVGANAQEKSELQRNVILTISVQPLAPDKANPNDYQPVGKIILFENIERDSTYNMVLDGALIRYSLEQTSEKCMIRVVSSHNEDVTIQVKGFAVKGKIPKVEWTQAEILLANGKQLTVRFKQKAAL